MARAGATIKFAEINSTLEGGAPAADHPQFTLTIPHRSNKGNNNNSLDIYYILAIVIVIVCLGVWQMSFNCQHKQEGERQRRGRVQWALQLRVANASF